VFVVLALVAAPPLDVPVVAEAVRFVEDRRGLRIVAEDPHSSVESIAGEQC
jgi:hypothetical protein